MTASEFKSDEKAVLALRDFLASGHGRKVLAVLAHEHPLSKLISPEASEPKMIRGAAKLEGEGSTSLLGKVLGYESAMRLLQSLTVLPPPKTPPASRRGGRREIPAESLLP